MINLLKKYPFYFRVSVGETPRFESLSQQEAELHARQIYKAEGVVPDINEIPRS